ncbi:hypothetical protein [Corynebacterium macclintockiae]|uniref:hypothetical protein n=1 Tax=Corynebacterium macclintockiae TaxID=2913501 RepID=UPI003EB95CFC
MHPEDPTRIPLVVERLRAVWEAQPSVGFAQLWAQLESMGVGFNATDAELVEACDELLRRHPYSFAPVLSGDAPTASPAPRTVVVQTADPGPVVTLSVEPGEPLGWAVVRGRRAGVQPAVWRFRTVRACRAGAPLVVEDAEGFAHRLGVVERLSAAEFSVAPEHNEVALEGLRRAELGDRVFVVRFADDSWALVGHALWWFQVGRRAVDARRLKWVEFESGMPGAPLLVRTPGAGLEELPLVAEVFRAS